MSIDIAAPSAVRPAVEVFKSKWGFHPVDYKTYLEVKALHVYALADYCASRRRERWEAKLPGNRVGKDGRHLPEPRKPMGTSRREYFRILDEYRNIRRPRASVDAVATEDLPRDWRTRLERYREYYRV